MQFLSPIYNLTLASNFILEDYKKEIQNKDITLLLENKTPAIYQGSQDYPSYEYPMKELYQYILLFLGQSIFYFLWALHKDKTSAKLVNP